MFGESDPGLEYFLQAPGYVCYTYPDSRYACTIEKRATRTRLVVTAAGCALASASWLRASSTRAITRQPLPQYHRAYATARRALVLRPRVAQPGGDRPVQPAYGGRWPWVSSSRLDGGASTAFSEHGCHSSARTRKITTRYLRVPVYVLHS